MNKKTLKDGQKAYQRSDKENRVQPYLDWHRNLKGLYMLDVDSIEWRFKKGIMTPVAVIEITRVDNDKIVTRKYLDAIIERFFKRDMQGKATLHVANALSCPAFITLFKEDCSMFYVYNLTDAEYWVKYTPAEYTGFLEQL